MSGSAASSTPFSALSTGSASRRAGQMARGQSGGRAARVEPLPAGPEWLERNPQGAAQSPQDSEKLLSAFKAFLAASRDAQTLSAADQELFKRFLEWRAAGAQ